MHTSAEDTKQSEEVVRPQRQEAALQGQRQQPENPPRSRRHLELRNI